MVACGNDGGTWGKYALDVAKVQGTQVTAATASLSTTSNQWQVNLTLNGAGTAAFSTLTSNLYNKYYTAGQGVRSVEFGLRPGRKPIYGGEKSLSTIFRSA